VKRFRVTWSEKAFIKKEVEVWATDKDMAIDLADTNKGDVIDIEVDDCIDWQAELIEREHDDD
jgi:hypothetical protein